jgi:hypothetical protein
MTGAFLVLAMCLLVAGLIPAVPLFLSLLLRIGSSPSSCPSTVPGSGTAWAQTACEGSHDPA